MKESEEELFFGLPPQKEEVTMNQYAVMFLWVSLLDLGLTATGIRLGTMDEINILLKWLTDSYGLAGLCLGKIALDVSSLYLLEFIWRRHLEHRKVVKYCYGLGIVLPVLFHVVRELYGYLT